MIISLSNKLNSLNGFNITGVVTVTPNFGMTNQDYFVLRLRGDFFATVYVNRDGTYTYDGETFETMEIHDDGWQRP